MTQPQATLVVVPVPGRGAEDVLVGPDGTVYTGTDDGSVFAVSPSGDLIRRVASTGGQPGASDVSVDDLPAHPDNIALGSDDLIWVTYASPKDPTLTLLQTRAPGWLRGLVRRAPEAVKPRSRRTVRVAAFDSDGRLVHDISATADAWHMATGVREHAGRVWLGSLVEPAIAWFAR